MKPSELKNFIKVAVKEAIQEELKNILLEAIKSNNTGGHGVVNENRTLSFTTQNIPHQTPKPSVDTKRAYMDILGEIAQGPKSGFDGEFKVQGSVDPINGSLPEGQLGLDQIMGLIKK